MDSLSIILENCYGIGSFKETFDFSESNSNLIYAPNGVMKTSLAKTFLRLSEDKKPEDLVFKKESKFDIKIDGVDILKDDILVIEPFDPNFDSQNISTLLVNKEKKAVYDKIYKDIIIAKKKLIAELNKVSKVPKEKLEETIISDIGSSDFFEAIRFLLKSGLGNTNYSQLAYLKIFVPKVLALLAEDNIKVGIVDYTTRYNELIKNSPLFMKSGFNPVKADTVLASLKKEMFFEAEHKLLLNGKSDLISNHADLETMLEKEKETILGDGNLKAISQKISKGVVSVKSFQDLLETHPEISAELNDLDNFKKVIWSSYYLANRELFDLLLSLFDKGKAELAAIEAEAKTEKTLWHEAKSVFKERFHIDFSIDIENQTNAILGTDEPNIVFTFKNNDDEPKIKFNRGQLNSLDFLSVGERRAMYLLYVIFEFKARKERGKSTLIIIDDIADSFDYKNKYAIIEYLKELSDDGLFGLLVLTHNFDFYRTFQSRILGERHKRKHSFIAQKESGNISLLGGGDNFITSPFDYWKNNFGKNKQIIVSMIPFVRNLVEYKDGKKSDNYLNLTSLLHIKPNTKNFTLSCLEEIISSTIEGLKLSENIDKTLLVIDFIYDTAELVIQNLINSVDEIRLENKVALSIAIRLKAEEFMLSKVIDETKIKGPQTGVLFDRLSNENKDKGEAFKMIKKVLSQVVLMTPENIHINSFMYEPLMDMSNHHLISLYQDIKKLEWDGT
jgi:energy-coupling factor transporter ATP-binding protein EcfA2